MKKVMATMRPKKLQKVNVHTKVHGGEYPRWDSLVKAVDEFRNYDNPNVEIEYEYYGYDGGKEIKGIVIHGSRLETEAEYDARKQAEKDERARRKAQKLAAEQAERDKELEQLAYLQEKYGKDAV